MPASIRRDLKTINQARESLQKFSTKELMDISSKAGELFLQGDLPIGEDGSIQSAQDYVETLSSTSGLPHVMVRKNMGLRFITLLRTWNLFSTV